MTERPEPAHDESAFKDVHVFIGDDGDGYYCPTYHNGERGPRSEGYRGRTEAEALAAASRAAARDFPSLVQRVEVDTEGD